MKKYPKGEMKKNKEARDREGLRILEAQTQRRSAIGGEDVGGPAPKAEAITLFKS